MRLRGCICTAWLLVGGCAEVAVGGGGITAVASHVARSGTGDVPDDEALLERVRAAGAAYVPEPVPVNPAVAELGYYLFFEPALSGPRTESCSSCHQKNFFHGFPTPFMLGASSEAVHRNIQAFAEFGAYPERFFWDGRVERTPDGRLRTPAGDDLPPEVEDVELAAFMIGGLTRREMIGLPGPGNELAEIPENDFPALWAALARRVLAIPAYLPFFRAAFPEVRDDAFTYVHIARAMLDYVRSEMVFPRSPWDRWLSGDRDALSDEALRGAWLFFGEAGCSRCHNGPVLSDGEAHVLAVPQFGPPGPDGNLEDVGRFAVTGREEDRWAFRTPPLRQVALTSPYMHNGAYVTLEDAVRHHLDPEAALAAYGPDSVPESYHGVVVNPGRTRRVLEHLDDAMLANLSPELRVPNPLSDDDVRDLVAFLRALTDPDFARLNVRIPTWMPGGVTGAM